MENSKRYEFFKRRYEKVAAFSEQWEFLSKRHSQIVYVCLDNEKALFDPVDLILEDFAEEKEELNILIEQVKDRIHQWRWTPYDGGEIEIYRENGGYDGRHPKQN